MLIDRGILAREEDGWTVTEPAGEIEVPDSVQALLAARIDLLDPDDKEALQTAAVIGRIFWTGAVYELLSALNRTFEPSRSATSSACAPDRRSPASVSMRSSMRSPARSRTRACRGRNALISMPVSRLGSSDSSRTARDMHASLLAHHYAEAVRSEDVDLAWPAADAELSTLRARAVHWLRRAAELAVGRYEITEGLTLLHRAVALEPDPVRQAQLWEEIGHANALRFDGDAFRAAIEQAVRARRSLG